MTRSIHVRSYGGRERGESELAVLCDGRVHRSTRPLARVQQRVARGSFEAPHSVLSRLGVRGKTEHLQGLDRGPSPSAHERFAARDYVPADVRARRGNAPNGLLRLASGGAATIRRTVHDVFLRDRMPISPTTLRQA